MIPQDEYEICYWLRNLAAHKHNDVRVALEAADEIERLRAELAELREACAEKQRCIDSSVDAQRTFLAEIDSLRHDIERHIAIASDLATENERLRAELEEYRRDAERYRAVRYGILAGLDPEYQGKIDDDDSPIAERMEDFDKVCDSLKKKVDALARSS